jgi:hypothetical protein
MTNKDTLKERVRQFMTDFDIGQRLFLNGKLHSTTWNKEVEAKLYTLIEQERQAEMERCVELIRSYRIYDWSGEQEIYNQLEEIIDRIQKSTPQEVTGNKE